MRIVLVIVMAVVALLVVFVGPVDAKRDPGPRGCSAEDWRYVLEGSDPDFRLCLIRRGDE